MNWNICYTHICVLLCLFVSIAIAQEKDSIYSLNENELSKLLQSNADNPKKALKYVNTYLNKIHIQNDPIEILNGYNFIATNINIPKLKLNYCDSIIDFSQRNSIHTPYFPFLGYRMKADIYFFNKKDYKKAVNFYIEAKQHIIKTDYNFAYKKVSIDYRIGLIKSRLGYYDEALTLFKKVYNFYSNKDQKEYTPERYLISLFALSDGYLRAGKIDSSSAIIKRGIESANEINDSLYLQYFIYNKGLLEYKLKSYNKAISTLTKSSVFLKKINDISNLTEAYYYIARSNLMLGNQKEGFVYLKKVDSIFVKTGDIHPEFRNTYETLIQYYSINDDKINQLKYLNRLLDVDKIISDNYKYLYNKVYKEYDLPRILKEKNDIITRLEVKSDKTNGIIITLFILVILICVLLILYVKRIKKYKENYNVLYKKLNNKNIEESSQAGKKKSNHKSSDIDIPEAIIISIKKSLKIFEEENQYLNSNITLGKLAKKFGSNTSYVSKVINHTKGRSFSSYLNFLRVNYSIKRLIEDSNFRKFTIKAIDEESGFKSAETYSKKFYELHGIYPSYFIKNIEKKKQS